MIVCQNKDPFVGPDALADFLYQIVYLPFGRTDFDFWVEKTRRADDLFNNFVAPRLFEIGGSGADINDLVQLFIEFVKAERPVVEGGRQAEPVFHKTQFPRTVPFIHTPDLGQGDVGFVDDQQKILFEEIKQGIWGLPLLP